jgi:hypothetical protein
LTAFTFDAPCKYDIILGRDFLRRMEIEMSFRHGSITCGERKIAMKPLNYWDHFGYWSRLFDLEEFHDSNLTHEAYLLEREFLRGDIEADLLDEDTNIKSYLNDDGKPYLMADRPTRIVNEKYDAVTPQQVIDSISHLSTSQKSALKEVLEKHTELFDRKLGHYAKHKVHLEVEPDTRPIYRRSCSVAEANIVTFRKELQHLVRIGVLHPIGQSSWAFPTFIIPKKDCRVRWISDFRISIKF